MEAKILTLLTPSNKASQNNTALVNNDLRSQVRQQVINRPEKEVGRINNSPDWSRLLFIVFRKLIANWGQQKA